MSSPHDECNPPSPIAGKPTPLPVNFDAIPEALRAVRAWVVWKYTPDDETGEVEWDKPPANARTGAPASSTDPATWSTFAEARDACRRGDWDGIGFCLDPGRAGP